MYVYLVLICNYYILMWCGYGSAMGVIKVGVRTMSDKASGNFRRALFSALGGPVGEGTFNSSTGPAGLGLLCSPLLWPLSLVWEVQLILDIGS